MSKLQVKKLKFGKHNFQQVIQPQVLVAGFFDGVHLGHQSVIKTGVRLAQTKNMPVSVLTFDRHPALVYSPQPPAYYQYLSPLQRKLELLDNLGVDRVYIAEFNPDFAHLRPQSFVEQFLIPLHLDTLVAGFDWTFGPKTQANMETLRQLAQGRFTVLEVPKLQFDQQKISSTHIRQFLKTHQIAASNLMLNYNYQNSGVVVHGFHRGRRLGFPTANLDIPLEQLIPAIGVYVTRVQVGQNWYPAMTSIGRNVTFNHGNNPLTVEANLLDFQGDLYGQTVKIEWLKYLRKEIKFANASELIQQMQQDQLQTQKYFQKV